MRVQTETGGAGTAGAARAAGTPGTAGAAGAAGTAGSDLPLTTPRVGQPGRFKWLFAAVWLFYLVDPVMKVAGADRELSWKLLNYAAVGVFVLLYGTLSYLVYPKSGGLGTPVRVMPLARPVLIAMGAIAFTSTLWINPELAGMWVFTGTGAGLSLPLERHKAVRGVLTAVAFMTVCVFLAPEAGYANWLELILPTFFAGVSTIGIRQLSLVIGQLREARETVARLAANEERLRLARDLHDLTGHSLSTITLKAELAQRLLQKVRAAAPDADPDGRLDAALTEVAEIEQVSRQTLTDIRKAVSGYRRATLAVELASASAALEAADIKLDADPAVAVPQGELAPELEAALAWSLREAVTNAIRHSAAKRVTVRLERCGGERVLTVRNDGRGLAAALSETDDFGGNGMTGLRERLDAVGGRLAVGGTDGDFRFVAAVPETVSVIEGEPELKPELKTAGGAAPAGAMPAAEAEQNAAAPLTTAPLTTAPLTTTATAPLTTAPTTKPLPAPNQQPDSQPTIALAAVAPGRS